MISIIGRPAAQHALLQAVARLPGALQTAWIAVLSLLLGGAYAWVHATAPLGPNNPLPAKAWFRWADQAAYFLAARAWATGNLDPSQHLYPAGYGLLAAPFFRWMPEQPFFVPDLLCWLVSLWLFAALAGRLAPDVRGIRAIGATVFFLATAEPAAFYTWEVPWTSTPAATLTFASLLLTVRHAEDGGNRSAWGAALVAGLILLFRPTDALAIMPAIGAALLATVVQRRPWRRRADRAAAAGTLAGAACAFAVGPVLLAVTHVAAHGLHLGSYLQTSRLIGFEWRLLPLRWVTLILCPQPLYPQGQGLAQVYWFVLPGVAGMLAALLADAGRRRLHALVGGSALVFVCLYLCYRDLQVEGLFTFGNQHYFKWTIPVFALYALGLVRLLLVRRRILAGFVGTIAVALLSFWRPALVMAPAEPAVSVLPDGRGLSLPGGLAGLDRAMLAASPEDFASLYFGKHALDVGGRTYIADAAFKVLPVPFGFMAIPLRPLPAELSVLRLGDPVRLDPGEPVLVARQAIVFGLPCSILPSRAICHFSPVLKTS